MATLAASTLEHGSSCSRDDGILVIETVAGLLDSLVSAQVARLDEVNLRHAPTIGAMYEGLSAELLSRVIPPDLDLKVTRGFVHFGSDQLSPQIDCMLVAGTGDKIPFTQDEKWHVKDVIAVVEVKKHLFGKELLEAMDHSMPVRDMTRRWVSVANEAELDAYDTDFALRTFEQMTATSFDSDSELSRPEQVLLHTLRMEVLAPVRIILGYHGYKKSENLRAAYVAALRARTNMRGFGLGSLPHLVVSGRQSLVKANGMPYVARNPSPTGWPVVFSTTANPILLMLEFIWTKIEVTYGKLPQDLWGLDLKNEGLLTLITAKVEETDTSIGWTYGFNLIPEAALAERTAPDWEPALLSEAAYRVIFILCADGAVTVPDLSSDEFIALAEGGSDVLSELLSTGLVSLRGDSFRLIASACGCAIMPDGRYVAGENNSGRLERWIVEQTSASE
jgi:hypothetical protein